MALLVLQIAISIILGEILIYFLFHLLSKFLGKANRDKITRVSIVKGLIERTFVVVVLLTSSALKIATRIKDTEDKVSNDFFLVGNLVSVLFGIGYYVILKELI